MLCSTADQSVVWYFHDSLLWWWWRHDVMCNVRLLHTRHDWNQGGLWGTRRTHQVSVIRSHDSNNNNNNNNNWDDIYGAVIMAKPLWEFTPFIWWMQTQHRGGHQPSDQANRLGLWVRQKEMAATVHIHHRHLIITQPKSWYSFYCPTEGGRLSQPGHCSKGVQPMPKAVYCSGCRDKHNCLRWDSNLGPLAPQSGMLLLGHWDTAENQ